MPDALRGVILKGIAGFYYVEAHSGEILRCRARGIFRKQGVTPLAGDRVEVSVSADGSATVEAVLPRLNSFERPPVANVETMLLVSAAKDPEPNFALLDRFTVTAEMAKSRVAVCVNKADIAEKEVLDRFRNVYGACYPVFVLSAVTGDGIGELREFIRGTQAALAGPSGAGKSTLANALLEFEASRTGEISRKTLRGRNTTRHTELFDGGDFKLFDTPGFTSFELGRLEESDLAAYFPEFAPYRQLCRFDDCRHMDEPGCAVAAAASEKRISRRRYASYKDMLRCIRGHDRF